MSIAEGGVLWLGMDGEGELVDRGGAAIFQPCQGEIVGYKSVILAVVPEQQLE